MRVLALTLLLLPTLVWAGDPTPLPGLTATAEADELPAPPGTDTLLADLRSADKAVAQQALASIPGLAGYPRAAQDLLPALLWMADNDDPDLAAAARSQAAALGWPKTYCLYCVRRLAVRQDGVYKLMGLTLLAKLAWEDPAAMMVLLEINRNHVRGNGSMIRAFAAVVKARPCRSDLEMQDWNNRAVRWRPRMVNALHNGGSRMRPIAEALLSCNKVDPILAVEAQAVLDAAPVPTVGPDPTR